MTRRINLIATLWFFAISSLTANLFAQLPATRLDGVHPVGGTVGSTLEVTISGNDLDEVSELLFAHAGIKAKQKFAKKTAFDEKALPVENQFIVEIAANVPPGAHEVRCRGRYGLSGPRRFLVTKDSATLEVEPNNEAATATHLKAIPGHFYGQLNSTADVDWIRFQAKAGQRIIVQAFANRLNSTAVPTLTLHRTDGDRIAESRQNANGDALIDTQVTSNGDYLIRVQEELFRGGTHLVYAIRIGGAPVIDCVFPPAGLPGSNNEYTVYGRNLPGGTPSKVSRYGQTLEQLKVRIPIPADIEGRLQFPHSLSPHQAGLDGVEYQIDGPHGKSNPVLLTVATAKTVLEQANNNSPQTAQPLQIPCEVMGQFYPQRDVDWYTFKAKKGDVYWLEVYSHRLGLATDATLMVQQVEPPKKSNTNKDGEKPDETVRRIAWVDDVNARDGGIEFDQRTHDPYYKFTAPSDGTYRVMLRESHSSAISDPQFMYRFAIRLAKPDYRLAAVPMDANGAVFIRQGGREAINITVFRQDGFEGEIAVTASGLPEGVTASPLTIGPGCNRATLVLTATATAAAAEGQLNIVGKARIGNRDVARTARTGHPLGAVPFAQPTNRNQASVRAKLTSSLPVVVTDKEKERVTLALTDPGKAIETARGGIVKVKYTVARDKDAGGNIVAYPFGGPSTMQLRQTNIGSNKAGEVEFRFPGTMPAGTYSMNLVATVQGMRYARNPDAVTQIKKRQTRINALLADAKKATQAATKAVQTAQTKLNQANSQLTQAKSALTTAQQTKKTADDVAKKTASDESKVQKLIATKPEDAQLKQQLTQAQQASAAAKQKATAAANALDTANKKSVDTTMAQAAAEEAKKQADAALTKARDFEREATQEKSRTDNKVRQVTQAARPRNINHLIYSQPVVIKIADYPFELEQIKKSTVKQGQKLSLPIKIKRLYGFDSTVSIQMRSPSGVSGLQLRSVSLAKGKPDGKIDITASTNATPGEHELKVTASVTFNGQRLTMERTFTLVVERVAKKTK